MKTKNPVIVRNLSRALESHSHSLEAAEESYTNICEALARDFSEEGGPKYESSSFECLWRDRKATIKVLKEVVEILSYPDLDEITLKLFFSTFRRTLEDERKAYKAACDDMAAAFRREDGPNSMTMSSEAEWRLYRATIRVREEVLKSLVDVEAEVSKGV